jgi:hypothetical protein
MTITREQAIELAKRHASSEVPEEYFGQGMTFNERWTPDEWLIAAIIEASQPIAEVSECVTRESAMRAIDHLSRSDDGGQEIDARRMLVSVDATVAHRQQQAAAKGGEQGVPCPPSTLASTLDAILAQTSIENSKEPK